MPQTGSFRLVGDDAVFELSTESGWSIVSLPEIVGSNSWIQSKVAVITGSCRAALDLDGRGARPHTNSSRLAEPKSY